MRQHGLFPVNRHCIQTYSAKNVTMVFLSNSGRLLVAGSPILLVQQPPPKQKNVTSARPACSGAPRGVDYRKAIQLLEKSGEPIAP